MLVVTKNINPTTGFIFLTKKHKAEYYYRRFLPSAGSYL